MKTQFLKSLLLVLVVSFSFVDVVLGQARNLFVKNEKGEPLEGVLVYSFIRSSDAEAAFTQASDKDSYGCFDRSKYSPLSSVKTSSEGLCVIECPIEGSILLDAYEVSGDCMYTVGLYHLKNQKQNPDGFYTLVLKSVKSKVSSVTGDFETNVTDLREFDVMPSTQLEAAVAVLDSDSSSRGVGILGWDEIRRLTTLDTTLNAFKRRGTVSSVLRSWAINFDISFKRGKSAIDLKDTESNEQIRNLEDWLNSFKNNKEIFVKSVSVMARTTPEGIEHRNRALSRKRTKSVRELLSKRVGGMYFAETYDEHDNVVPWSVVADTMQLMQASEAQNFAEELRGIVKKYQTLDEQYYAIRLNPQLYQYVCNNVLNRVSVVEVNVEYILSAILSRAQIVDIYHEDSVFLNSIRPYQAYELLCYLAAEEQWDELYNVSKSVYEYHSREHRVKKYLLETESQKKLVVADDFAPYPLAAYYYALTCLKKGEPDLNILKPYLDDGRVSVKGLDRHDNMAMNLPAFISVQTLMYCQAGDFANAEALIRKYNLQDAPEFKDLVAYVGSKISSVTRE